MNNSILKIRSNHGLGNLSLGMHRDMVVESLRNSGDDYMSDDLNYLELNIETVEMWFDSIDTTLRQIRIADETVHSERGAVIGRSLTDALSALDGSAVQDAYWRLDFEPPIGQPLSDSQFDCPADPPAELLLASGTLWIPSLSLGLIMQDGLVSEVVMQSPTDMPLPPIAPFTARHWELAKQSDLQTYLRRWARRRASLVVRLASWLFAMLLMVFTLNTK